MHMSICLNKSGAEQNFLNLIKDVYEEPTANIIPNDEVTNAFSLRESEYKARISIFITY